METPPTTPTRGLNVLVANTSPFSIETVTSNPSGYNAFNSRSIIARGTGLIAGSPTGSPMPGNVTVPIP